jgi:hypothetical protein
MSNPGAIGSAGGRSTCTSTRCAPGRGHRVPQRLLLRARAGRLRGAEIAFPQVTVMGTENAILAATLAEGKTTIRPAAQEPEVDDLIVMLQKMGAEVERTRRTRSWSRASAACAARSTTSAGPHRGGHVRGRRGA